MKYLSWEKNEGEGEVREVDAAERGGREEQAEEQKEKNVKKEKDAMKVHNKVISGFRALRQARAPVAGLEPRQKGPCISQGGLTSDCATDAPSDGE
ncbi:hypothetical protein PoB_000532400 [Plakobranchus ocellatus]|uniref:Uncharacterized protein n=1 Tax=Plakobranchus ocellatus TaxID=259542 RepID=A0AAV3Y9R5_9GAST|nr:hypothetical protein PoB_000532400 [Plakobranchus ocellatus]